MFFIGYGSILAIFTRITCIIWRVCFAGTETLAYHSQSQVPGMGNAIAVMDQLPASAVENPGNGVGDRCTMTCASISEQCVRQSISRCVMWPLATDRAVAVMCQFVCGAPYAGSQSFQMSSDDVFVRQIY